MKTFTITALFAALLVANVFGQGTVIWNELVDGPLSNEPGSPTSLGTIQIGTNSILGTAAFVPTGGGPGGVLYSDFITFSVNATERISGIVLQADAPVAIWIGNPGFSSELASIITPVTGSLLPQLGLQSILFGNYGFYVANWQFGSSPSVANYQLDFLVQSVPEPSTLSLLLAGAGFVGFCSWRKSLPRRK